MWHREGDEAGKGGVDVEASIPGSDCRRAYYRVAGFLPIRLMPLRPEETERAVFDLSLPNPCFQPLEEGGENAPLMARLRQIEEKLDLLLGLSGLEAPQPLSGADRQSVVFSGSGLSLDVTWSFLKGDAYHVEVLLPSPYSRVVRGVGLAVSDSIPESCGDALRPLAVELRHMEPENRDALIAYSYDLQRIALRARGDEEVED